jgi:hypothetical protein
MPGFSLLLRGAADGDDAQEPQPVFLVLHNDVNPKDLVMPEGDWWLLLDTDSPDKTPAPVQGAYAMAPGSLLLFCHGYPSDEMM